MPSPTATTVRQARAAFFHDSGFPADGGYDDPWAEAAFGPLRYRVPNGPARAAALRIHDLHHIATGYATDWRGESEISGWELGSGAGRQPYAWLVALWGLFVGLLLHPAPTFRAFARGRRSTNLYGAPFDSALLDCSVEQLRDRLSVTPTQRDSAGPWSDAIPRSHRATDAAAFAGWSLAALLFGAVSLLPAMATVVYAAARERRDCPLAFLCDPMTHARS